MPTYDQMFRQRNSEMKYGIGSIHGETENKEGPYVLPKTQKIIDTSSDIVIGVLVSDGEGNFTLEIDKDVESKSNGE